MKGNLATATKAYLFVPGCENVCSAVKLDIWDSVENGLPLE